MIIPIIVIILCSIGIYYIYYYKKNQYYKDIVEKFMIGEENIKNINFIENDENNIENFENMNDTEALIKNALNNPAFTRLLANGDWTTDISDVLKHTKKHHKTYVSNLMKIDIDDEGKGTIDLTSTGAYEKYNITSLLNMTISGQNSSKRLKNKSIVISFDNPFTGLLKEEKSGLTKELKDYLKKNFKVQDRVKLEAFIREKVNRRKDGIIKCRVQIYQNNNLLKDYISYKIFKDNNIGGELSRLISSKQYYDLNFNMKYDLNLYNKYLQDYKYPNNMFTVIFPTFIQAKNHSSTFKDTLSKKYSNQLYVCYSRSFLTIDNQVVTTKMSQPYVLKVVSGDNYFQSLELKPVSDERRHNNISKNFPLKYTTIYFYKMTKTNNTFSFLNNMNIFKNNLNFKNGADSMFNKNMVEYPNINNTQNNNKNTYNLVKVKQYTITNENSKLSIPWTDFQTLL